MTIPKIIHQIYLSGSMPPILAQQVNSLKERNPDWDYRLYDNNDAIKFIIEHYGNEMEKTYRMISEEYGAARADLLRHLLIYHYGGVYLDIKSNVVKPLNTVLRHDDQYLLSQWDNGTGSAREGFGLHPELASIPGGEYQTHAIFAAPRHAFSRAAIDHIVHNIWNYKPWSGVGKMGVVRTTGPSAYTLAVYPILATAPHRMVTEEELGLEFSIKDYDHRSVFKKHYSVLTGPVVKLGFAARTVQKGVEFVRAIKRRVRS